MLHTVPSVLWPPNLHPVETGSAQEEDHSLLTPAHWRCLLQRYGAALRTYILR